MSDNLPDAVGSRRGGRALRSLEAAALAGLAHAVLFAVARLLLLRSPEPGDPGLTEWYGNTGNQRSMIVALNLTTIGSIAFVWFVAVIRRRVGERENQFFGTVFLGSALLSVSIWMVGTLLLATPAVDAYMFGTSQTVQSVSGWRAAGAAAFTVVAVRLEAVFIISATTVARLSDAFPRGLVISGYSAGLLLLFAPVPTGALAWVFSVWVVAVSCVLLIRHRRIDQELSTRGGEALRP